MPSVSKAKVTALAEGTEWLERGANVLLFGPPRAGTPELFSPWKLRAIPHHTALA